MVTDLISGILLFCIGGIIAMIIDVLWWNIDYKKAEKGFEVMEHYHLGIILFIGAVIIESFYASISWLLIGMGFLFFIGEWRQSIEISGKKVIPGKPFAYGSVHFKKSTVIGVILAIILLIFSLVL